MKKRLTILLLIAITFMFADEFLVKVDLNEERLAPLADKDLKIIGELETIAFLLIEDADLDELSSYSYEILDHNPQEGKYYFVRTLDATLDLYRYGEILTRDGDDYFMKIDEAMHEELIKEKIMIRRLSFNPIVIKSEVFIPQFRADTTVQEIVDLVDPDSVLSFVQRLQDFITRYSTTDSCVAAVNYVASKFIDYGCDSVFFQDHIGAFAPNVIGVKCGVVYPDSIYAVVCGHLDATSYLAPNIAPGADDNASGTVGAIEAARVMQNYDFEYSVRYIAFTGEEQGLLGSEYYAYNAFINSDDILGVLNGDMIGYVDAYPESVEVLAKISNPNCEPFADFYIAAADTYTTLLTRKNMVSSAPYSDHAPFWDYGFLALCSIEDSPPVNPYYHEPGDTIGSGYNANDFCTEVIKAQVAALSLMAVPYFDVGVEENEDMVSHNTSLTIYPNVGNSRFNISFTINNPNAEATLKIYNALGERVKTFSQPSPIIWNGVDDSGQKLSSGIYIVRLDAKESSTTEKVLLLK